jgi:hypothetical protein
MKETLTEVVVTYFRILKSATDASAGIIASNNKNNNKNNQAKHGHNSRGSSGGGGGGGGKAAPTRVLAQWRKLLPAALEGLSCFAHLVNVDTVRGRSTGVCALRIGSVAAIIIFAVYFCSLGLQKHSQD